jgi:antitoxin HicB
MNRFLFPIEVSQDEEGFFLVLFPDIPEAGTDSKSLKEALTEAEDCLSEAIAGRIKRKEEIPVPSRIGKRNAVTPNALITAKAALYLAWQETGLSCLALSKKLGIALQTLQRMLDPKHRTHIGSVEAVLKVLGARIIVDIEKAA